MPIVVQSSPSAASVATLGRLAGLANYGTMQDNRAFQRETQSIDLNSQAARQADSLRNSQYLAQLGEYGANTRQASQLDQNTWATQFGAENQQYLTKLGIQDSQVRQNQSLQTQRDLAAADAYARSQMQQQQIMAGERMAMFDNQSRLGQMGAQAYYNQQAQAQNFGYNQQAANNQFERQNMLGGYRPAYTEIAQREFQQKQGQLKQQYEIAVDALRTGKINQATFNQMQYQLTEQQTGLQNSFRYDPMELQGKFEENIVTRKYQIAGVDGAFYEAVEEMYMDPRTGQLSPIESSRQRSEYQMVAQQQQQQAEAQRIQATISQQQQQNSARFLESLLSSGATQKDAYKAMYSTMQFATPEQRQEAMNWAERLPNIPVVPIRTGSSSGGSTEDIIAQFQALNQGGQAPQPRTN